MVGTLKFCQSKNSRRQTNVHISYKIMISLPRLRLITFDVTNTLLQFRSSRTKQYGELGALFGVLCDKDKLAGNFKATWYKMNQNYPNFGRNSHPEWQKWWYQVIADTFTASGAKIPDEKLDDFSNHLVELYKTSICWAHCNGTHDILNYFRRLQLEMWQEKNATSTEQIPKDDNILEQQPFNVNNLIPSPPFVMGVIANFDPRLNTLLRNMRLNHFFKFALNSYDCGIEKPSKDIFDMALQAAELPDLRPIECLHIGDGPTTDYFAAKAAGWNAALVHEKNLKYLLAKYGNVLDERYVFPSFYDFQKKLQDNVLKINW